MGIRTKQSNDYNWIFDTDNGTFVRWGKCMDDDPKMSPIGPEIADIEISTICNGPNGIPCSFCYKSNTGIGYNMSLDDFKIVIDKIAETGNLTQVALGIGDIDGNPDLINILKYCREISIVPNITINGFNINKEFNGKSYAEWLAKYCGAVAVSDYIREQTFNTIKLLKDKGLSQINIHKLLCEESIDDCIDLLYKRMEDPRIQDLNAIVFLWLKPKGKRNTSTVLKSYDKFKTLLKIASDNNIAIGFDSCSAYMVMKTFDEIDHKKVDQIKDFIEPCESTLFSCYISADCKAYPCSFSEDIGLYNGIKITKDTDFIKDVWFGEEYLRFRNAVLRTKDTNKFNCRKCPIYKLDII